MIASIGPALPIDLLAASGRYKGPLGWNLERETPKADAWLESKFPLWARAILEDWAEGSHVALEAVVFGRADDAAQRLYYYVCELQRRGLIAGPRPLILDIAKIPRPTSEARTIAAIRRLAQDLAVGNDELEDGIARTNAERRERQPKAEGPVCLLVGTPPLGDALHEAIGRAGFRADGPTLAELWGDPGPPVEEGTGDPAAAIGRQLAARPDDQRGFGNAAEAVLERARRNNARAAVQWYAEEDEARVWDAPAVTSALASASIPTLVLTRRDAAGRDGAAEEIDRFLKEIRP